MIAGLAATLAHPRWWALALAAFLVRGGILLLAVPILALPTVPDLAGAFGTTAARLALGQPAVVVALAAGALLGAVGLVLALGAVGAALEQALVAEALADEDVRDAIRRPGDPPDAAPGGTAPAGAGPSMTLPALSARLLAHAPTAVALGWAGVRIGTVVADQLLAPREPGTTVLGRVLRDVPEALVAPVVVWALAELVAGVAVRRLETGPGPGIGGAGGDGIAGVVRTVAGAAADVVRRPRIALAWLAGTAALAATVAPTWLATSIAYDRVRSAIAGVPDAGAAGPALLALVTCWIAGLGLVGIAAAWRSVATTVAVAGARRRV